MSKTSISAIIVDDSLQARRLLRLMLSEVAGDVKIFGEAANVSEAVLLIQSTRPDLVFLDIEMPEKSGLQLVEEISREEVPYEVIFTTAYNEYALRAFRLSAIDYLLKPIDEKQLVEAVDRVRKILSAQQSQLRLQAMLQNMNSDNDSLLTVPCLNGYVFQKLADILYIKASGSYAEIHLLDKAPLIVSRNLKYFESALEANPQFVRVHRSYLINIQQMKRFDKTNRGEIVMNDDIVIDLSRDRRSVFLKALNIK